MTDDNHSRRAYLGILGATGTLAIAGCTASGQEQRTLEWGGQGSENATLECGVGEDGFWKWVLTPGGSSSTDVDSTELTVTFEDGSTETASGFRPGGGEQGAVQFEVFKSGGGTVADAEVTFSGGGDNVVLTISESECVADGDNGNGDNGDNGDNGGSGDDTLVGGTGDDYLNGDAGDDTYDVTESPGQVNHFVGGSGDDTVEYNNNVADYQINRADYLAEDDGSGGFMGEFFENSPDDVSGIDFTVDEPIFRIDYVYNDGKRHTDYVQAENIKFSDVTLVWGTLTELGESGLDDSFGGDDFVTSSGDVAFTYNGGGLPAQDSEPNYVLGSSNDDTITGSDGDDIVIGQDGDDHITGGIGVDTLDGGSGADNYYITPQIFNDDGDNKVGDESESGDSIADTGSGSNVIDQVHIIDGGTVRFDWGTLTGVEEVLFDLDEANSVYVTSDQFDGVDVFDGGNDSVGGDLLEIEFSENGDSDSGTIVRDVESVILDSSTDGSGGINELNAQNITTEANVFVRGGATNDIV